MLAALSVSDLSDACGDDPGAFCRTVWDSTNNEALASAVHAVERPIQSVAVLVIAWIVMRVGRIFAARTIRALTKVREFSAGNNDRSIQRTEALQSLATSAVDAFVGIVAVLLILKIWEIDITPIILGASFIGAAFGFGAQQPVRDSLTGIFILIEDQYGVGDWIKVGEVTGKVESVGIRTTRVRDAAGTVWHLANGELRAVGNLSQEWATALLDVEVARAQDLDVAQQVIGSVARQMFEDDEWSELILEEPRVLGVEAIRDDRVLIRLTMRTKPGKQFSVTRELRGRMTAGLLEANIATPVPAT